LAGLEAETAATAAIAAEAEGTVEAAAEATVEAAAEEAAAEAAAVVSPASWRSPVARRPFPQAAQGLRMGSTGKYATMSIT
jgi:hypothetical protein